MNNVKLYGTAVDIATVLDLLDKGDQPVTKLVKLLGFQRWARVRRYLLEARQIGVVHGKQAYARIMRVC